MPDEHARKMPHPSTAPSTAGGNRAVEAMASTYGELQPVGGGDPIPLLKPTLVIGRRESSDIVLRFPNVSGTHCELSLVAGHWVVKDLGSSNGTKVNGTRVSESRLDPGDKVSIGRHEYEVSYDPAAIGDAGGSAYSATQRDIFSRSLLDTAGLENRRPPKASRPRS
jgi:predicted component of type VI protein secretion system